MPTAAFTTLGCRVNQYETQAILESFAKAGFTVVPITEQADVYVVNSCSVTGNAESKSRQLARSLSRKNPQSKVVVTGCAAQMSLNSGTAFEGADLLVSNPEKLDTAKRVIAAFPELLDGLKPTPQDVVRRFDNRTRATIKIQDGCNVLCSYCSIPYTRPERRSRPYQEILDEADRYARLGHHEIVVAGVLIGDYGPETGSEGPGFEELLFMLCDNPRIARVRISSIEFRQVTPSLIDLMSARGSKICPHLHIPLQSGSDKVLSDMNRPYGKQDYLDLCKRLHQQIPDLAISTDIMVGFPTETEDEFRQTVDVCELVKFCKGHIFRFSPRPGTPAHKWGDPVRPEVKSERSSKLIEITNLTKSEFLKEQIGTVHEVTIEHRRNSEELLVGLTGNYIDVRFNGPDDMLGGMATVRILDALDTHAVGELVRAESTEKLLLRVL